jgi:hypothetical protein
MESDRWDDFWQWHKRRFAAKASTVLQRLKVFGESVLKSQWSPPLFIPTMWVCFPSWEWPFPWRVHVIARLDGCLLWPFWPGLNFVEDEGTQEAMAASLLQDARWMLSVCVSWFKLLEAGIWTSYAFKSHDDDLIATNGSAEICGAKLPTSSSHLFHLVSIYATEIYWTFMYLLLRQTRDTWQSSKWEKWDIWPLHRLGSPLSPSPFLAFLVRSPLSTLRHWWWSWDSPLVNGTLAQQVDCNLNAIYIIYDMHNLFI